MPTNWSYGTASAAASNAVAFTPAAAGQLLLAFWCATLGATAYSSASIADTGSGGWTQIGFVVPGGGSSTAVAAWFKVATAADLGGITVTATGSGGSGGVSQQEIIVESYTMGLAGNVVKGIDLKGTGQIPGSGQTSLSFSPSVGSSQPANTDELAWACVGSNLSQGGSLTGTFTGTSPTTNMALGHTTTLLYSDFLGGVQASATAGTNVWHLAWTSVTFDGLIGATFFYGPASEQVMIV